jgi:DNA-binding response OmpR family regulator
LADEVRILVVDDDQLIQALVEDVLSDSGFASVLTASGEEATTLLRDAPSKYRAIVTDINLESSSRPNRQGKPIRRCPSFT